MCHLLRWPTEGAEIVARGLQQGQNGNGVRSILENMCVSAYISDLVILLLCTLAVRTARKVAEEVPAF